jgi:hypothetical protein
MRLHDNTGLQMIALHVARHRMESETNTWPYVWSSTGPALRRFFQAFKGGLHSNPRVHGGEHIRPSKRFATGVANLHPAARATVEQSILSIMAKMRERAAEREDQHLVQIDGVKHYTADIRFMDLQAGQMRRRQTVRRCASTVSP